jgi:hypothetical protein
MICFLGVSKHYNRSFVYSDYIHSTNFTSNIVVIHIKCSIYHYYKQLEQDPLQQILPSLNGINDKQVYSFIAWHTILVTLPCIWKAFHSAYLDRFFIISLKSCIWHPLPYNLNICSYLHMSHLILNSAAEMYFKYPNNIHFLLHTFDMFWIPVYKIWLVSNDRILIYIINPLASQQSPGRLCTKFGNN